MIARITERSATHFAKNAACVCLVKTNESPIFASAISQGNASHSEILSLVLAIQQIPNHNPMENEEKNHAFILKNITFLKTQGYSVVVFTERAPCEDLAPGKTYTCDSMFTEFQKEGLQTSVCYAVPAAPGRAINTGKSRQQEDATMALLLPIAVDSLNKKTLQSIPSLTRCISGNAIFSAKGPEKINFEESPYHYALEQKLPDVQITLQSKNMQLFNVNQACTVDYRTGQIETVKSTVLVTERGAPQAGDAAKGVNIVRPSKTIAARPAPIVSPTTQTLTPRSMLRSTASPSSNVTSSSTPQHAINASASLASTVFKNYGDLSQNNANPNEHAPNLNFIHQEPNNTQSFRAIIAEQQQQPSSTSGSKSTDKKNKL